MSEPTSLLSPQSLPPFFKELSRLFYVLGGVNFSLFLLSVVPASLSNSAPSQVPMEWMFYLIFGVFLSKGNLFITRWVRFGLMLSLFGYLISPLLVLLSIYAMYPLDYILMEIKNNFIAIMLAIVLTCYSYYITYKVYRVLFDSDVLGYIRQFKKPFSNKSLIITGGILTMVFVVLMSGVFLSGVFKMTPDLAEKINVAASKQGINPVTNKFFITNVKSTRDLKTGIAITKYNLIAYDVTNNTKHDLETIIEIPGNK